MQECYRVLLPKGKLRISCPDLRQYIESYLVWDQDTKSDKDQFTSGTNFLNYAILGEARSDIKYLSKINHSKDYGHRYYYDEEDLRRKLTTIGFKNVVRCLWGESSVLELQNLEWRKPLRDLIIEATK